MLFRSLITTIVIIAVRIEINTVAIALPVDSLSHIFVTVLVVERLKTVSLAIVSRQSVLGITDK